MKMNDIVKRLRDGWDGVEWDCSPNCDLIGYGVHHAACVPTYVAAAEIERLRGTLAVIRDHTSDLESGFEVSLHGIARRALGG